MVVVEEEEEEEEEEGCRVGLRPAWDLLLCTRRLV